MSSPNQNKSRMNLTNILPWVYNDSKIEVALTGKAFNYIVERKHTEPFIYQSVIAKG